MLLFLACVNLSTSIPLKKWHLFQSAFLTEKTSDKAIPEKRKKSCYTYFTKQALPFLSRKSIFCDYVGIYTSVLRSLLNRVHRIYQVCKTLKTSTYNKRGNYRCWKYGFNLYALVGRGAHIEFTMCQPEENICPSSKSHVGTCCEAECHFIVFAHTSHAHSHNFSVILPA